MSDLIKALRKLHESHQEVTTGNQRTIFGEAADAIESSEAKLKRIRELKRYEAGDDYSAGQESEYIYGEWVSYVELQQALEEKTP